MKRLWGAASCAVVGLFCLLSPFHIGMTGVCLLLLALVLAACHFLRSEKGRRWRRVLLALTALSMAVIFGAMGYLALDGRDDTAAEAEFVVVLGAQTHGDRPSRTLRERLDRAVEYLAAHPSALAVVSGGQGADETQTEASVMAAYLQEQGIEPARILQETEAATTRENLQNSRVLAAQAEIETDSVLIITSEFHLSRAKFIARSLGMEAYGLGSTTTPWILKVNYLLREVFAYAKAIVQAA